MFERILFSYFDKLTVVQILIESALCHKFIMRSLFDDTSVFHDKNLICISNRRKTMRYDKACTSLHKTVKSFLNHQFSSGIDTGSGFIQYQHWRQTEHDTGDTKKLFFTLAQTVFF